MSEMSPERLAEIREWTGHRWAAVQDWRTLDELLAHIDHLTAGADDSEVEPGTWRTPGQLWQALLTADQDARLALLTGLTEAAQENEPMRLRVCDLERHVDHLTAEVERLREQNKASSDQWTKRAADLQSYHDRWEGLRRWAREYRVHLEGGLIAHLSLADEAQFADILADLTAEVERLRALPTYEVLTDSDMW
jgi:hypothetical protein